MFGEFWVGQRLNCDINDPEREAIVTAVEPEWIAVEMEMFGQRTLVRMDRSRFRGMPRSPFGDDDDHNDDGTGGSAMCSTKS
jgi:hypothetical protein